MKVAEPRYVQGGAVRKSSAHRLSGGDSSSHLSIDLLWIGGPLLWGTSRFLAQ